MSEPEMGQVTENILSFMMGGKADFTIHQSPNIDYAYNLRASQDGKLHFLYMNGEYQGFIRKTGGQFTFSVGKKGNAAYDEKAIHGLLWVLNRLLKDKDNLPSAVQVYHHMKCAVCGRKLTDPESIRTGMGPTCREKFMCGW